MAITSVRTVDAFRTEPRSHPDFLALTFFAFWMLSNAIERKHRWPFASAISAANQHCARLSKQLLVMSSSANTVPNENNPGTERKRERRRCVRPLPASHPLRLPSTASSRSRGEPQGVGFGNSLFFAEAVRF